MGSEMCQRATTAYHEAGHAVIADYYRVWTDGIRMERDEIDSSWNGALRIDRALANPEVSIPIGIAGPLAEAKFMATCRMNDDVKFAIRDNMSSLASDIVAWNDRDEIEHQVSFVSDKSEEKFAVNFSDDIARLKKSRVPLYTGTLITAFFDVRKLFDDNTHWKLVKVLANHLVTQPARRVQQVSICGKTLAMFLEMEKQKLSKEE